MVLPRVSDLFLLSWMPYLCLNNSLFLSFAAYFGLGAYYNYSTYGARGYDLIP